MSHCIYPGTFDPVTCGHLDVLKRAARLFDQVTVGVATSTGKNPIFSAEQRLELVKENITDLPNVNAMIFDGLLIEFATAQKATALIRGLRAVSDFEYEYNMALMNRHLRPDIETIFVMPHEQYSYISSSLVKQVARYGGNIRQFVPQNVSEALEKIFLKGKS